MRHWQVIRLQCSDTTQAIGLAPHRQKAIIGEDLPHAKLLNPEIATLRAWGQIHVNDFPIERQMLGLAHALPEEDQTAFLSFAEGGRCRPFLAYLRLSRQDHGQH